MDSISQVALGAAVGVAVMGRRTSPWRAALWGGLCGTLPDLDAFIDHGDPVSNVTLHRAESHSLFWLSAASLPLAWLVAWANRQRDRLPRWWLAVWLALVTHPLLDAMTIYGTRLALPFTDRPFGTGSLFIIDPLYTLPLLAGLALALGRRPARLRWNTAGLVVSTLYAGWSLIAQQQVAAAVHATLAARGGAPVPEARILITPTPFNTVLWRVVVMHEDRYEEGFRSLLDRAPTMRFHGYPSGRELYQPLRALPAVERMVQFTHGFFRLAERDGRIELTDLRMGQEPWYSFSFVVAQRDGNPGLHPVVPVSVGGRQGMDVRASLRWLGRRALGADVDPPPR
ncbi:MAG: metal-dependent hydrolase [Burkholderiales bacterium]|nr:metal-dependent hydrolase [Burkholderiales bacterium]OJX00173.1 MAG: hydrolase [Burkholderiales bacterium 70-64]